MVDLAAGLTGTERAIARVATRSLAIRKTGFPVVARPHNTPRLVASGLRHGYQLGNTLCCWYCDDPIDPTTRACGCWQPNTSKLAPTAADADTPEKARLFFESIGIKVSETVTVIS